MTDDGRGQALENVKRIMASIPVDAINAAADVRVERIDWAAGPSFVATGHRVFAPPVGVEEAVTTVAFGLSVSRAARVRLTNGVTLSLGHGGRHCSVTRPAVTTRRHREEYR